MLGASYRDFAIIARSLDSYSGILDTSLEKAGVPHFFSSPKSINSFEAIKLINTAYSTVIRRFATADVLTYVKCGLIDATRDECDLFELYVNKWKIGGSRFTDELLWNMNPRASACSLTVAASLTCSANILKGDIILSLISFIFMSFSASLSFMLS